MRTRQNVLDLTDKMNDLLEASKVSMERHTIDPTQLYKNLIQLQNDLERLVALIKREPEEK